MTQRELIQLPNKDLWRGRSNDEPTPTVDTIVITEAEQHPLDKAIAAVLQSSKGAPTLSCLWCGQQGNEKWIRDHLKEQHKSVVEPVNEAQIVMADMAQATAPKA